MSGPLLQLGILQEVKNVFNRFINFYNQERIHGCIAMLSPNQLLQEQGSLRRLKVFSGEIKDLETKLVGKNVELLSCYLGVKAI